MIGSITLLPPSPIEQKHGAVFAKAILPISKAEEFSMRLTILILALSAVLAGPTTSASAWWDEGHMQIAYVAYKNIDAPVRDKLDALLKLNSDYPKWTAGTSDEKTAKLYAFGT